MPPCALRLIRSQAMRLVSTERDDEEQGIDQRARDHAWPPALGARAVGAGAHGLVRKATQQRVAQLGEGDKDGHQSTHLRLAVQS